MKTLTEERAVLLRWEKETEIRRSHVSWLEGLSLNWSLKDRTRWRDGIPDLPSWEKRTGQKRTNSNASSKPVKIKRMRLRFAAKMRESVKDLKLRMTRFRK